MRATRDESSTEGGDNDRRAGTISGGEGGVTTADARNNKEHNDSTHTHGHTGHRQGNNKTITTEHNEDRETDREIEIKKGVRQRAYMSGG
jgi:hypothetical protein